MTTMAARLTACGADRPAGWRAQAHLAPFLPTHPLHPTGAMPGFKSDDKSFGAMAAAPYGSSLILPISYAYISMMGSDGLTEVRPVILEACPCSMLPWSAQLSHCWQSANLLFWLSRGMVGWRTWARRTRG